MARFWFLISGFLLAATAAFGQTPSADSQTLQALLAEVHQLRQDLQTTTVIAQRAHILLYRLQAQETATARATQRADDARLKLSETQSNRKTLAAQIKQFEDMQRYTENSAGRKDMESALPHLKSRLETLGDEEQQRQTRQIEAEEQLRTEQAKLSALQYQLDQLENTLKAPDTRPAVSTPQ
jgi:chromosome segregation ATPase